MKTHGGTCLSLSILLASASVGAVAGLLWQLRATPRKDGSRDSHDDTSKDTTRVCLECGGQWTPTVAGYGSWVGPETDMGPPFIWEPR